MGTPRLNILLLGPPLVTLDGKPVKINRQQPRALLYYLAAQIQPSTRSEICNLFWPEENEDSSRKHLRETLSHLRQDLRIIDAINTSNDQLSLNPDTVYSDMVEFRETLGPLLLMNNSPLAASELLPGWMVAQLTQVMALCRSTRFLQGIHLSISPGFDNWVELTNQTYVIASLTVIRSLINYYISNGNLDGALTWLYLGSEIDPLDFDMNYLTLTCLRDMGRTQQLIDYANYQESLFKERKEPIPTQLHEIRARAEDSQKVLMNIPESTWPLVNQASPKFLGRQDKLVALNRLMRRKGIVHLRGEAGSGKTRLLKEFFDQQPYAPRLVYCQAQQVAIQVPFQTLVEGLEKVIQPEDWTLIDEKDREILSKFFHHQLQNSESPASMDGDKRWLPVMQDAFYAFLRLMEKVAIKRPVLFILDDAWWSDEASLTILWFLVENKYFKNHGTLIIVTRLERSNETLNQMILRLKRSKELETITLENFTSDETGQFLYQQSGKKPGPTFLQKMMVKTGGNLFFLVECFNAMKNSKLDISSITDQTPCPSPESIEGLVWEKVHLLDPGMVKVLKSAAVLGNWFTPDVLELMFQMDTELFLTALERIKQAGFIDVDPGIKPAGGYRFCHDIEREIIELSLDPARRRVLHLKAADAIIKRRGKKPEIAARLARHYEEAGEPIRAVDFCLEAGRYASSQFSQDDAYASYARALDLIVQNPYQFSTETIHQAVIEWSAFALDRDDTITARQIFQTSLELGNQNQVSLLIGTALSGLGRIAGLQFEFDKAQDYFRQAIIQLNNSNHPGELAEAYSRLGIMYFMMDDYIRAKEAFEEGLKVKGQNTDPYYLDARINILTRMCITLCFMGYPVHAYELALQMLNDCQKVSSHSAMLRAHTILALTHYYNDRMDDAIQTCQSVQELSEKLNIQFWKSLLDLILARSYLRIGHFDQAWLRVLLALEREKNTPLDKLYDQALAIKADIYRMLEEYEKAIALYQSVIDSGFQTSQAIESYYYMGLCLINLGKTKEGLNNIDEGISLANLKGLTGLELIAKLRRLLSFAEPGNSERRGEQGRNILDEMRSRGMKSVDVLSGLIPAQAAELRGEKESAIKAYEETVVSCTSSESVWFELFALERIIHLSGRKNLQGKKALERAEQIFESLSQYALTQPVQGMFRKFRKKWMKSQ